MFRKVKDSAKDSVTWEVRYCLLEVQSRSEENSGSTWKSRTWFTAWIDSVSSCLSLDKPHLFNCVPRAG